MVVEGKGEYIGIWKSSKNSLGKQKYVCVSTETGLDPAIPKYVLWLLLRDMLSGDF